MNSGAASESRHPAWRRQQLIRLGIAFIGFGVLPIDLAGQTTDPPPVRGSVDALLEVVEFSDFECPFCGRAKPVVDSLLSTLGDRVRFEYRHYPLPSHPHAGHAAEAAVEAHRQRAFWPYHDLLFANQDRLADDDLVAFADSLGLNGRRFAEVLEIGEHEARVQADLTLGFSLAVTGTPTFFVNGYRVVGVPPLWVFELALEAAEKGLIEKRPFTPADRSER